MSESSHISIRPATPSDASALSRLCLLTADNGVSAAPRMRHRDLPGLALLLPYLYLPSGFCFVLVETTRNAGPAKSLTISKVVGCVAGTSDAAQFAGALRSSWWPMLRERFPRRMAGTPLDRFFVEMIHKGLNPVNLLLSPVSLRVHVLPTYQAHGCDRLLLDVALRYIKKKGKSARVALRNNDFHSAHSTSDATPTMLRDPVAIHLQLLH